MRNIENITPLPDAMDKGFRFLGDKWAQELHKNLKLQGKFDKLLLNDTVVDAKKGIRMDLLIVVKLKNKEKLLINIKHQSQVLNSEKIKVIDEYKNYSKCRHKLPLLTVVISPFPKNKHLNRYESTESDILEPVFITFDDEEIKKKIKYTEKQY